MQRLDACSNIANKVLTIPTSIKQLPYTKELDYDWVLVTSYHQCEDACIYHSYFNYCKGTHTIHSLIPRPRPAFHHLQYRKAGRAWYLFSRKHDKKLTNAKKKIRIKKAKFHALLNELRVQHLVCISRPPLARYMQ